MVITVKAMLPPGIHLLRSGLDDLADPVEPDALAALHPAWAEAVEVLGPWLETGEPGMLRSGREGALPVVVCGPCSTTMDVARRLFDAGVLGEWGSVVAPVQRAGRGQLRRPWVSRPGNMHASMVWPHGPADGPWAGAASALLPLLAGYCFATALSGFGAEILVKWPNDLLLNDRKVGGMLAEERAGVSVLGLGINLAFAPPDEEMRSNHAVRAGIFSAPGRTPAALPLWEALVNRSKSVYENLLDTKKPDAFLDLAAHKLAWLGSEVVVRRGVDDEEFAVVAGLAPDGGLVLRGKGRNFVLRSGSIFRVGHGGPAF